MGFPAESLMIETVVFFFISFNLICQALARISVLSMSMYQGLSLLIHNFI